MSQDPMKLSLTDRLALERTRIAYERTMLAWLRTAISLITFGFAVYKFFQLDMHSTEMQSPPMIGPREFGLGMIASGLLALLVGVIEHARDLHLLRKVYPGMPRSASRPVAAAIGVLGGLALMAVLIRV